MARNPNAQKFATEIEPNFDGGLVQNTFIKGTLFIFQTIEQRNNLGPLYRQLDNETTTLALVVGGTSDVLYKLISNPATGGTTDLDWQEIPLGNAEGRPEALGEWDAVTGFVVETGSPLLDTSAPAQNGNYYVVTNSPNGTTNTYPGLFRGVQVTTFNGDTLLAVGNYWAIIRPATTWETLNVPSVIRDYENGIVIAHNQDISTINGLSDELATKYDEDDVANTSQNFNDIPDSKLVNLDFTREYYYRKFISGVVNSSVSTYSAAEIDNLIAGATASLFDWNREIRRLPQLGEIPGGDTTTEGLEEIYYGQIDTVSTITQIDTMQIGQNTNPRIRGTVVANDGTIQLIQIIDENDLVVGLPSFTPGDTVVNVDITLATPIEPIENDTRNYRIRAQVIYPPSATTIDEDSDPVTISTVYPYLYGMAATGLDGTTIYGALFQDISLEKNQEYEFTGTGQRVYFAFPDTYADLISILDETNAEHLDNYNTSTVTVDSVGLATNWSVQYKVYELGYDITLDTHLIKFFSFNPEIETLDDIAAGDTNKHFTQPEKNKLAGIPSPGDIGDMKKSVYDPDDNGYVEFSEQTAVNGINNTGLLIGKGQAVHFTQVLLSPLQGVEIVLADKDSALECNGIALEDIANGSSGTVVRNGAVGDLNTDGFQPRDTVYLGNNGSFIIGDAPASGLIQPIGQVSSADAVVGTIYIDPEFRDKLFTRIPDWQPLTFYDEGAVVFYEETTPDLVFAIIRSKEAHTSTSDFTADFDAGKWQELGGDMLSLDYDPADKRVSVYDMDNMEDGLSLVAMTTAERTKLAGLETPTFKGTFETPDDLRLAFPGPNDPGDNANVVFENDGTTPNGNNWIWDTLAPPNVSPPTVGGDWVDSGIAVGGNMRTETYDPTGVSADAFAMGNMVEQPGVTGPEAKILTQAERTKLAGIEAGAQVNPTAAQIKTEYESNPDTNAFTDSEQTKLSGIEAGAEVNQSDAEIKAQYEANADTNAYTDAEKLKLQNIEAGAQVNKQLVMGSLLFDGTALLGGEIVSATTLSAFTSNVGNPSPGRIDVSIACNVVATFSATIEHLATNDSGTFQVYVNGVAVPVAIANTQNGSGNQNTPQANHPTITIALQLAANDYVSVFYTGDLANIYNSQLTLHGQEQ